MYFISSLSPSVTRSQKVQYDQCTVPSAQGLQWSPEACEESKGRGEAWVHSATPLLHLLGSCLQLSQQKGVQGWVAVEELRSSDCAPRRLPLYQQAVLVTCVQSC